MQIINDLFIEEQNYSAENNFLTNLSRINVFVGANNAGKSRFLRSIFYFNDEKLKFIPRTNEYSEFMGCLNYFKSDGIRGVMGTKTGDAKKVYNSMFNLINIPQYFRDFHCFS